MLSDVDRLVAQVESRPIRQKPKALGLLLFRATKRWEEPSGVSHLGHVGLGGSSTIFAQC